MENNIFMGGGFFGSRQLPVSGPVLGQLRTAYSWNQFAQPMNRTASRLAPARLVNPGSVSRVTRPTAQPISTSPSDVHCYFCENLPDAPTYWMSESQAAQWNQDREARCNKVNSSECQKKYNQMQASQQAAVRRTGFNAFNLPGSTTFAASMSGGIRVENPELIG